MIYSITEDSLGRLWLNSGHGDQLVREEERKSSPILGKAVTDFLQTSSTGATWHGHLDSYLAFGSIRPGLNFFQPNGVREKNDDIRVVFTRFLLNNHEQTVRGAR